MIIPARIQHSYSNLFPYLKVLEKLVDDLLLGYCKQHGFAYSSRVKAVDSLAEKIESGRYRRWTQLDDLFAATIVIPNLTKEETVVSHLQATFAEVDLRRRASTAKDPETFRFDSTRYIGRVREPDFPNMASEVLNLAFEVQVRSAFEHAWSTATHALAYKDSVVDWRRKRLAAQLKASVEQLDLLILTFEGSAQEINQSRWPEIEHKARISEFFRAQFENGRLPQEVVPKDWSRFCDNVFALLRASDTWPSRRDKEEQLIDNALSQIRGELDAIGKSGVPLSVSLFQFVMGVLITRGVLSRIVGRFVPLVTPELTDFYPSVRGFTQSFTFDDRTISIIAE